jgi:adenine-specific DNA-methyltransferase
VLYEVPTYLRQSSIGILNRKTKRKKAMGNLIKIDVLEGLKQIETASQDLIIADPPYYKAINEGWDKQWKTEHEYLDWCKLWFVECVRALKDTGSFYCYGNFDILSKQKVLIFDKQLNFRQNITLDKGIKSIAGRTSDKLRLFPTASEYLLFYIKDTMPKIRLLLKEKRAEKGYTIKQVAEKMGVYTALYGFYEQDNTGSQVPTSEQWDKIKDILDIDIDYSNIQNTFNLPTATTDVWSFTPDKVRYGHPTQKPQDICHRIIKASSNENDNVLIPFSGSGSECVACEIMNRNWTAFDNKDEYIEITNQRLNELKLQLF